MRPIGAGVEGTVAYAASEYVAAESLDVALKHYAPASLDKVLPFITQLAGAIDFARAAGIGLGALHPRDIFVTPDEARVTGFGVVQALERLGVRAPVRRPYTAPERVDGAEWDVRADVHALGAIAFELLTARRPVGPQVGDLGSTAGPFQNAVAQAIARALADDPAHRYASALAFAAALEAASRGEQTPGALEDAQIVAATASVAPLPVDQPSAGARDLTVEPDIEVERDVDEAEIQLREHEAFARETEDLRAEARPEPGPEPARRDIPARAEPEPEPASEPREELPFTEVREEPPPEPTVFDFEPEQDTRKAIAPEEFAEVFPPETETPPSSYDSYAPSPRHQPPPPARRPRPVFLPVALTLLLGLFVGFLAGYLVGSRDTGLERGGASPSGSPSGPERSAPQVITGGPTPSGSPSGPERSAPRVTTGGASAPGSPSGPGRPGPEVTSKRAVPRPTPPVRGRMMVRSTPGGALVFVNGRRRGITPLAIRDLAPGTYTLRVARSGYQQQSRKVVVNGAAVREINLRLEPSRPAPPVKFTGSLYVDSRPRGARVFLDGKEIGTTPMQAGDIRAGAHVVRLELKDHRTWTASTNVVAGEVTRVTGSLERQQ